MGWRPVGSLAADLRLFPSAITLPCRSVLVCLTERPAGSTSAELQPSLHGFAPMSDPCVLPLCSAWFPDGFPSVPLQ